MQPGADKNSNPPGGSGPFLQANPLKPSPFTSSGPMVGMQASGGSRPNSPFILSRPTAGSVTSTTHVASMPNFPGAMAVPDSLGMPSPVTFNGNAPPPAYNKQDTSAYQPFQVPRFMPPAQPLPAFAITPQSGPVIHHPGSVHLSQTGPVGLPSQASNQILQSNASHLPPFQSSLSAPRPPQTPSPGEFNVFPRGSVPQAPVNMRFAIPGSISQPPPQTFPTTNFPYHPSQGGFAGPPPRPPPIGAPIGSISREQVQYPSAPPLGASLQGLIEDFQSIALGSTPGSLDPGIDPHALPRPLDSNEEAIPILDKYPLNCHPEFLRLTTHALPSSQSLLSRWHLPLGAVVHPMAEVPNGVS